MLLYLKTQHVISYEMVVKKENLILIRIYLNNIITVYNIIWVMIVDHDVMIV